MTDAVESSYWAGRRVLVTGASGLLGGWLVRRLLGSGAVVTCLVRQRQLRSDLPDLGTDGRLVQVSGDIRDAATVDRLLAEQEVQTVFHLAAQAIVGTAQREPTETLDINVRGSWTLLDACRRSERDVQVIVTSSDKAYGEHPQLPYREDMALLCSHPYETSKACADLIASTYAASYDMPIVVTRCGNFFGGGDLNWNRIIPGTIRSLLEGKPPLIRSDGLFVRDYLYAEDAAAAHMMLAELLAEQPGLGGQVFNFSHEVRLTVLEVVQAITRLMGATLQPDVRNEASHEIRAQYLSAEKARTQLGWRPLHTMEEGLRATIDWYRGYLVETGSR